MLKCNNPECGNKARGDVSAICRKCGYVMIPLVEKKSKKYESKKEEPKEEIDENGDR